MVVRKGVWTAYWKVGSMVVKQAELKGEKTVVLKGVTMVANYLFDSTVGSSMASDCETRRPAKLHHPLDRHLHHRVLAREFPRLAKGR